MKVIKIIKNYIKKILNYLNIDERKLENHQRLKKILSGNDKNNLEKI